MNKRTDQLLKETIEVAAQAGFVSKNAFNLLVGSTAQRTLQQRWKDIAGSKLFEGAINPNGQKFLKFTRLGIITARKMGLTPASLPFITMIPHDSVALEIALRLVFSDAIKSWIPESQMELKKTNIKPLNYSGIRQKFPDLIVDLNVPKYTYRVAIEVELTMKSRRAYRDILRSYAFFDEVAYVIFVTKIPAIEKAIKEALFEVNFPTNKKTILFTSVDKFQSDPVQTQLTSHAWTFSLGGLVKRLSQEREQAA